MMLLCPEINCHTMATQNAMSEYEQRSYKANPYNRQRGYAEGSLALHRQILADSLGSVQFVGDDTFLQVDDKPLLSLNLSPDGRLLLSIDLYDKGDNLLAVIDQNEWIAGAHCHGT